MKPPKGTNAPTADAPEGSPPATNCQGIVRSRRVVSQSRKPKEISDDFQEQMVAFFPLLAGFALFFDRKC